MMVLSLLQPVWGAVCGRIFLQESLAWRVIVVLPVCALGVLLMAHPWATTQGHRGDTLHRGPGIAVCLVQGVLAAGSKTTLRALKGMHAQVPMLYLAMFTMGLGVLGLLGIERQVAVPTLTQFVLLIGVGLLAFCSQTSVTLALRSLTVTESTIIVYLNLVWSTLAGVIFFAEVPDLLTVVGMGL